MLDFVWLSYHDPYEPHVAKRHVLGAKGKTADNRIFYYAQNDSGGPLEAGVVVAAPLTGQFPVWDVQPDGRLLPKVVKDTVKYAVTPCPVGEGEYFWAQCWGYTQLRGDPTVFATNLPQEKLGLAVQTAVGYVESDGTAYLTMSP